MLPELEFIKTKENNWVLLKSPDHISDYIKKNGFWGQKESTIAKAFVLNKKNVNILGDKARSGKISIEDLQGGTFTITNGGIYGSMLSTPILNPPQSAVLGMHNIVERPIVVDGNIEIRPVMYLALSYDHRIIDGKEAVSFLKIIKESLEQPKRLFLNI